MTGNLIPNRSGCRAEAGHHLIAQVKENQPTLLDTVTDHCLGNEPEGALCTRDKGRLRDAIRTYEVFALNEALKGSDWQTLLAAVVRVTRQTNTRNAKTGLWKSTCETAYYVCDIVLEVEPAANAIRQHWGIENRVHYVRDATLAEYASRIRKNPGLFARIRSFSLNIFRFNGVENIANARYRTAIGCPGSSLIFCGFARQHRVGVAVFVDLQGSVVDEEDVTSTKRRQEPSPLTANVIDIASEIEFVAAIENVGERLDRLLAAQASADGFELSRTRLKQLILDGRISVAGAPVCDPALKVAAGASIKVRLPPVRQAEPAGEQLPLEIVFEDAHLLVLDKAAGIVVHPSAGHAAGTLVNALIAHCGDSLSGIGGVARPGIVHRLDKDTSGLMVVAKTDAAHRGLSALFADHGRSGSLVRKYLAIAWGVPARARGTVDAPLARHAHNREKIAVAGKGAGRTAVTHWEVEERFGSVASLVVCRLETGRTHQIRVHLAHIGHPLLGDATYGAAFKTKASRLTQGARNTLEALGRQALHAATLGFEHPVSGEPLSFTSPLPPDIAALTDCLREAA